MLVGGPTDCKLVLPLLTESQSPKSVSEGAKVGSETGKPRAGRAMLLANEATASTVGALKY